MTRRKPQQTKKWNQLNQKVEACTQCERLIAHCKTVASEKRAAYRDEVYWGKPVANFGDPFAQLLVVGLAPGAHGANRTGRMFTGDRSGDWLYKALHKAGFASQPDSSHKDDGLQLINCTITNACHCAPPGNSPTAEELRHCQPWLEETFELLPVRVILALGGIAWTTVWRFIRDTQPERMTINRKPTFAHGAEVQLTPELTLLGSYHPSQQNTFTGRLTEPMLNKVMRRAKKLTSRPGHPGG